MSSSSRFKLETVLDKIRRQKMSQLIRNKGRDRQGKALNYVPEDLEVRPQKSGATNSSHNMKA